ncbi:amidohydrolase family protein [Pseudonocardia sp. N23]|uniref:amidohydrolase family protein n=1 Tax=Pseudonocardia sp. N23 TaxID=1987376 RepID=UPI000BFE9F65|nr:amidohydrolase family protein [Pseudonocardia sp. N23]
MTDMLILGGRVLIGPPGASIEDGAVLIRGEKIAAVGPRAAVLAAAGGAETVIDCSASTLLPGLVDAHAHLVLDGSADPVKALSAVRGNRAQLLATAAKHAEEALLAGVTTMRDAGDVEGVAVELRDEILTGARRGPRLLACGAPVTTQGGDGDFFGGEATGEVGVRKAVEARAGLGADHISLIASGGHLSPDSPPTWQATYSQEEMVAAVDEAHRAGLPITAQAHASDAIERAVLAGADIIGHCSWVSGERQVTRSSAVAAKMAALGTSVCVVGSRRWRLVVENMGEARAREAFYDRLPWLDSLGVRLLIGTRAGTANAPFGDIVSALEMYEWAGLPRERILELATVGAAAALGLADITGRLEPGLCADLIAVDGDPRLALDSLRTPRLVIARGELSALQTAG